MQHFDEGDNEIMDALREANPARAERDDEGRQRLLAATTATPTKGTQGATQERRTGLLLAGAGALGVVVAGVVVGAVVLSNGGGC